MLRHSIRVFPHHTICYDIVQLIVAANLDERCWLTVRRFSCIDAFIANCMSFMSKTAAFMGMGALRNLVSDSMAIDMGSAATIIYVRGRGVVVDEPSLVAVNNITGEVIAIGLEAQQMYGREAREVTVIAPLLNGVVADFERTKEMLGHFVRKARSGVSHFSRRALMSVLSGTTQVEQRALLRAAARGRPCSEGGRPGPLGCMPGHGSRSG